MPKKNIYIFVLLIFFQLIINCNAAQKSKEEAMMEFYEKYKKASYPPWLKKVLSEKSIIIPVESIGRGQGINIINFENLLLRGKEKIKQGSYEKAIYKNLYIMLFESGQKYIRDYFSALKQIESQAFLSLVVDPERRHESLVAKGFNIEKSLDNVFASGSFFYYEIAQILDVIPEEKFLTNILSLQEKINHMSQFLIKILDPSDFQSYILAIKGVDQPAISHRMEIYRQLELLSSLAMREIEPFSGKDEVYKEYDMELIKNSYLEIKVKLEALIRDKAFENFKQEERDGYSFIIKTELEEIKNFFKTIGFENFDSTTKVAKDFK